MSVALAGARTLPRPRPRSAEAATGPSVASRRGEFLGSVERNADGTFIAFDGRSTPIGRYSSAREAKRAIRNAFRAQAPERHPRMVAVSQALAPVCGVVSAGMLAAAAVVFLPL